MILSRKQLSNILYENLKEPELLNEVLPLLAWWAGAAILGGAGGFALAYNLTDQPLADKERLALYTTLFVKGGASEINEKLGTSFSSDELKKLLHAAYSVPRRESDYGAGGMRGGKTDMPYVSGDMFETSVSQFSKWVEGFTGMNVKDASIGIGSIKSKTADTLPGDYKELIDYKGNPSEITGTKLVWEDEKILTGEDGKHVKSVLIIFGLLCQYAQKAISLGYSFDSPGTANFPYYVKQDNRVEGVESQFKSTGSSAIDLAIAAYNFGGSDKAVDMSSQGQNIFKFVDDIAASANYIPCLGNACATGQGVDSTLIYVKKVAAQMRGGGSRILEYWSGIDENDIVASKNKLLSNIAGKNKREKSTKARSIYPRKDTEIKSFREYVNKNHGDELDTLYANLGDKELSPKSTNNESEHFWLAFEKFGTDWFNDSATKRTRKSAGSPRNTSMDSDRSSDSTSAFVDAKMGLFEIVYGKKNN